MPARPPVKTSTQPPVSLGDEAQKIRDRLDGIADNPVTATFEPRGEDNAVPEQRPGNVPLVSPEVYHTYGLK